MEGIDRWRLSILLALGDTRGQGRAVRLDSD